jgi:hypothetical protein
MKLALASLLVAPVVAFAPSGAFGTRRSAMQMSTEASTETKVRFSSESHLTACCQLLEAWKRFMFRRREVQKSVYCSKEI